LIYGNTRVAVFNIKEWLSVFDGKLRQNSNGTKARRVLFNIMVPELVLEAIELLHPLVDSLMPAAHSRLHSKLGLVVGETLRAFDAQRGLSNVPIISFNSLVFFQKVFHAPPENLEIVHVTRWKGPINVNNVASLDAETDKIPQGALELVLVAPGPFAGCLESKVGAISRGQTVIALISLLSLIP